MDRCRFGACVGEKILYDVLDESFKKIKNE